MAYIDTLNLAKAFVGGSELQSIWVGSMKVWDSDSDKYRDDDKGGTISGWMDNATQYVYAYDYNFKKDTGIYQYDNTSTIRVAYSTMANNPQKQYIYSGSNTQRVSYYQYYSSQSVPVYTYSTWLRTAGDSSSSTSRIYASDAISFSSAGATGSTKAWYSPSASTVDKDYYIVSSPTVYTKYTGVGSSAFGYRWFITPYNLEDRTITSTTNYTLNQWVYIQSNEYYLYDKTTGSKTQYKITYGTREATLNS